MSTSNLKFSIPGVEYKIDTAIVDKSIEQSITDFRGCITKQIINTKEEHVRLALISLGWTPPRGNE